MTGEMKGNVEELAEALVMADPADLRGLADIHTSFETLGGAAAESSLPKAAEACRAAADAIESIILDEVSDKAAALDSVGGIVTALQSVICEGRDEAEVDFPRLGNGGGGAESAGAIRDGLAGYVDEAMLSEFLGRQPATLDEIERLVLSFEREADENNLGELRRIIHTLKGESAMLGMGEVERACHRAEDALNAHPAAALVDGLLSLKDWLGRTFDAYAVNGAMTEPPDAILAQLTNGGTAGAEVQREAAPETAPASSTQESAARQLEGDMSLLGDFVGEANEHLEAADISLLTLETDPKDEDALNAVFRAFHTIKGVAGFMALGEIQALAHEAESLLDKARKGELELSGAAIDATFDAVDMLKRLIANVNAALAGDGMLAPEPEMPALVERITSILAGTYAVPEEEREPAEGRLGEILVNKGVATEEQIESALDRQEEMPPKPRLGELLVKGGAPAKDVAQALRVQKGAAPARAVRVREAVKVDADRLDRLVDMIGEMVIAESMVSQSPEVRGIASPELSRHLSQLDKITRELQEMGMSLRMIPVRATFQKMARLVRDVAKKSGKRVNFVMTGEDTELDKSVVDQIGDPLVHMVRNAVDHGLEPSPEARAEAGKPPEGQVELRAFHKGGSIYIEIEDDGRGLDRDAIIAKAIERGLIDGEDSMSDREVYNLIFEPGFSTAKKITDVSGRGVGMDVVRRNIEALRGQVDISSEPGKGSVFSIRLPLTLAIIDGMVVRVAGERYIVPTLSVVMSIRPEEKDLSTVVGRGEMLSLQGELIPLFRLNRLFSLEGGADIYTEAIVVIVEDEGRKTGLMVDELLGQQQIVIKSLGDMMQGVGGIAGGAIMPDGQVGLILDVGGLVKVANEE